MKKILPIVVLSFLSLFVRATNYNIGISGNAYNPVEITVKVGDQITISASSFHPLVQVSQATWDAKGKTPVEGGWGTKTANYTFTVTEVGIIYFVCSVHVAEFGMRGKITVEPATGIDNATSPVVGLSVYPNPARTNVTLSYVSNENSEIAVRIFNITGQLEKELFTRLSVSTGETKVNFDVSELQNGMYFLEVTDNRQRFVSRLNVQK
jgi:plastocyanin